MINNQFDMPVVNMLLAHSLKEKISFHMPGHKAGKIYKAGFFKDDEIRVFLNLLSNLAKYDITEVNGTDNLHYPESVIKEAMQKTADVYGSYMSYFLVNGSTCGINSMIFSTCKKGDFVLVSEDCHISVFNALMIIGCIPIIIPVDIDSNTFLPVSISSKNVKKALTIYPEAVGLIMTRPNYYGFCADILNISANLHKENKFVIVDEAHGGHFGFTDLLPASSMNSGADLCVQSAHKTLQSINQGAYLHISDKRYEDKIYKSLRLSETTSPSYLIMATLDFTREYMRIHGKEQLERLTFLIKEVTEKINKKGYYRVFDSKKYERDITRLVVNINGKADILSKKLVDRGIYPEMNDKNNVVFIVTCADDENSLSILSEVLTDFNLYKEINASSVSSMNNILLNDSCIRKVDLLSIDMYMHNETQLLSIDESKNRMCAQFVTPYPPGVPVIYPGETITKEHIAICHSYCIKTLYVIK